MIFDSAFFREEEREGFLIASKMKHAWAAQMEVLKDIEAVCERHGLQYFAAFGTLLGAVRHHGFIPWDDDMDIFMKREDYDRFWQVAAKDLPPVYIVYNMHTETLREICYYTRVISGQYTRFDEAYLKKYHGFPYVTGVDIFPIDAYPPEGEERQMQRQLLSTAQSLLRMTYGKDQIDPALEETILLLEEICQVSLPRDGELAWELMKLQEKLVCAYQIGEEGISEVGIVNTGWPPVSKGCFESAVMMPYENTAMPVPAGYDEVLCSLYGKDYMIPKQYVSHSYPFYKGQEEHFRQVHGFVPEIGEV